MNIGTNILKLRKRYNLSQEELAIKVNVTRQTISNWELETSSPDLSQAIKLSTVFNISISDLIGNIEEVKYGNFKEVFEKALEIQKEDVSVSTYNVWLKTLKYKELKDDVLYLTVELEVQKKYLELNEIFFLKDTINKISDIKINKIQITVE